MTRKRTETPKDDIPQDMLISYSWKYMAGDYSTDATGAVPTSGSQIYRVDVQVLHASGAPAANMPMGLYVANTPEVTQNGGLNVTLNNQAFLVPPVTAEPPANINTDEFGKLVIEIDGSTSPSVPQLLLFDFDPEAIFAYMTTLTPDADNISRLSGLQGSDIASSNPTAVAYDNQPLIDDAYQGDLDAIAQGVQNTMGAVSAAPSAADVFAPRPMRRIARDALDDSSGLRPWQPGGVTNFLFSVSATGVNFDPGGATFPVEGLEDLFGDFGKFIDACYKEGKKVVSLGLQYVEDAGHAVIQSFIEGAEDALQFAVTTVEDAAKVVGAVLQSVAQSVERALEWLSWLFDWKDFVKTAEMIAGQVTTTLNAFATNLQSTVGDVTGKIDSLRDQIETNLSSALASDSTVSGKLGTGLGDMRSQTQSDAQSQNPTFMDALASNHSQMNWAAGQVQSGSSSAALAAGLGSDAALSAFQSAIKNAWTTLMQGDAVKDAQSHLQDLMQSITATVKDADTLMGSNVLADLLADINNAVSFFLDLLVAVVDGVLDLFSGLVTAVVGVLESEIDTIPILSDVYSAITGGDKLTLINLASLVVAIPTTLVYKALYNSSPADHAAKDASTSQAFEVAKICRYYVSGAAALLGSIAGKVPVVGTLIKAFITGLSAIGFALGFSALIEKNDAMIVIFLAAGIVPLLVQGGSYVLAKLDASEADALEKQVKPILGSAYGVLMLILACAFAFAEPDDFFDPDGFPLLVNVVDTVPDLFEILPLVSAAIGLTEQTGEFIENAAAAICPVLVGLIESVEMVTGSE